MCVLTEYGWLAKGLRYSLTAGAVTDAILFTLPVASVTMVTSLFSETSAACNDDRR